MKFLKVDFNKSKADLLHQIDKIAEQFSENVLLKINETFYRIVDFEFYPYCDNFKDIQTHKKEQQLQNSKLYLHGSGIDITFGDGKNYGGILLRGVIKLNFNSSDEFGYMETQFDGPQNVATELFSSLNIGSNNLIDLILVDDSGFQSKIVKHKTIIKTKRVGLTPKAEDLKDDYLNFPLRYIVVLPICKSFKQKIKGIETYIKEANFTQEKANEILGYNLNFNDNR